MPPPVACVADATVKAEVRNIEDGLAELWLMLKLTELGGL
jgi:hypothetical protein